MPKARSRLIRDLLPSGNPMTALVLFLAALHGIAVVGATMLWPSRTAVVIAAVLSSWVAVEFGGAAYTFVDLIGVCCGTWIAWKYVAPKSAPKPPRPKPSQPSSLSSGSGFSWIFAISTAAFVVWSAWNRGQPNRPPTLPAIEMVRETIPSATRNPPSINSEARAPSSHQSIPTDARVSDDRPRTAPGKSALGTQTHTWTCAPQR